MLPEVNYAVKRQALPGFRDFWPGVVTADRIGTGTEK